MAAFGWGKRSLSPILGRSSDGYKDPYLMPPRSSVEQPRTWALVVAMATSTMCGSALLIQRLFDSCWMVYSGFQLLDGFFWCPLYCSINPFFDESRFFHKWWKISLDKIELKRFSVGSLVNEENLLTHINVREIMKFKTSWKLLWEKNNWWGIIFPNHVFYTFEVPAEIEEAYTRRISITCSCVGLFCFCACPHGW